MNGQSTLSSTLRGIVMLGGLVAVPAIALFGNKWTDSVKQVIQQQLGLCSTSRASMLSDAPLFVPGQPSPTTAKPVMDQSLAAQPLAPPVVSLPAPIMAANMPAQPSPPPNWPQMAMPTPTPAQAEPFAPPPAVVQQNVMPALNLAQPGPNAVQATAFEAPPAVAQAVDLRQPSVPTAAVPNASSVYVNQPNLVPVPHAINTSLETRTPAVAVPDAGSDRFGSMHSRLRQLGATYCLLESWGPQSELYRFHCKMAIGGSANFTRSFEATDPDPVGAMARVMEQVEQWQAARPQGGR